MSLATLAHTEGRSMRLERADFPCLSLEALRHGVSVFRANKISGDWDNAMQLASIEYDEFEERSSLTNAEMTIDVILGIFLDLLGKKKLKMARIG